MLQNHSLRSAWQHVAVCNSHTRRIKFGEFSFSFDQESCKL